MSLPTMLILVVYILDMPISWIFLQLGSYFVCSSHHCIRDSFPYHLNTEIMYCSLEDCHCLLLVHTSVDRHGKMTVLKGRWVWVNHFIRLLLGGRNFMRLLCNSPFWNFPSERKDLKVGYPKPTILLLLCIVTIKVGGQVLKWCPVINVHCLYILLFHSL